MDKVLKILNGRKLNLELSFGDIPEWCDPQEVEEVSKEYQDEINEINEAIELISTLGSVCPQCDESKLLTLCRVYYSCSTCEHNTIVITKYLENE